MAFINQGRLLQSGTRSDGPYMRNFKVDGSRTDSDAMAVQSSHFERFMHFATSSNIEDRQLAVKSVAETMRTLDIDADQYRLERFGGMVESIFETDEDSQLRCILLEQMPAIYSEFANAGLMGSRTQEVFLKIIIESLVHFSDQVRKSAIATVGALLDRNLLIGKVLEDQICPELLNQTSYQPDCQPYQPTTFAVGDEHRLEATTLLCKIVTKHGVVSRQWIFETFIARFSFLLQDPMFHIRRVCVSMLGDLATLFGQHFAEQFVVPFLITLSQDPVWGVRKACCEVFVEVAATCSPRFKETQLAPRFIKLLSDSSRWVCCAAFEQLGPFIATFADSARTGLEIRDGRLAYTAESSSSCSSLHHLPTSFSSQDIGSPSSTNDGTSAPTAKTRLFYDDHNGAHNSSEASTCNVIIDSDDNSNDNAPIASSVHNNITSDNDTEDEYQFYKLPKDVCLPVSKEDFNYEVDEVDEVGRQCEQPHQSSQILSGDEHLLKEFYGLLDSWTLDQKGDVRGGAMSSSMIAAAACSTEDDLSKLEFGEDADDDEAYLYDDKEGNNNVEVLGENGFNHHDSSSNSTEAYGGVESVATTADDDFSELKYWSSNFVNIDLRSYGHKSNSKSVEATNLSNAYMERRMNMFVDDAVVGDSIQMKAVTPNNCQQEQNRVEGQWSMSNEMNGKNERANLCTSIASGNNKSLSTTKSRAITLPSNEDGYACVEFDGSVMKEVKRHSRAEWSSASAATVTRLTAAISSASSTGYNSENSAPIYMHAHCNSNQNDNCNGLSKSPVVNGEYNIANNGDVAAVDSTSSTPNEQSEQIVPKELLDSYVNRISGCANNEPDINRHCAHNFPAVAFTLGRRNWPQLLETYNLLAADLQWRVRQSLASSMHEVAAIIGEENADAHLVPVFEQFMKDVEDVRLGLLKHLYDFFKLVTPATRKKLLTVLASFLHSDRENERNWRSRHEYTRQCAFLCDLYDVEDVNEYIAAIALTLATDRVADVRSEAAFLLAKVLAKFVKHEWNDDANLTSSASIEASRIPVTASFVNDIIKGFAYSKSWRRRQTFAIFCEKTLELGQLNYEQFRLLLLRDLLRLGNDVVPNIRLAFARTMCRCTATATEAASIEARDDVVKVLKEMMNDSDADCRRMARRALLLPDSENFIQVKGREIIDSSAGPVTQATLIIDDNAMTMNDKFVIEQLEGAQGRAAVGCECGSESNSQLMQHQPASIYILEDETVSNSSSP